MTLRQRLAERPILLAPGIVDPLTGLLAENAGAEAAYLTGAGIAYTRLGRPDIGLVTANEVAETLALITDRIALPVIVDADTGFGNAMNLQRTVRRFERAGAAAIQIEDQTFPKRCGHLRGKALVPASEMAGKIRAAVDARQSALIIARTDAIGVEGFQAALDRAEAYLEAGADLLFVEAPRSRMEMAGIAGRFAKRVPLLANMVEGGDTPMQSAAELEALGYALVIFPGGIVRALAHMARDYYTGLLRDGSNDGFRGRMFNFAELNAVLGTEALLARGKGYE
ncbi:MAG: isocitrate lyase/phosphoenolpyruvate mutase family protein [Pseudomonadota bacterium]